HAKSFAAVFTAEPARELSAFVQEYRDYFAEFAGPEHQCLDTMPRYGVWQDKAMVYFAANSKRLGIVADITRHTVKAMQQGEALGGWQALPRSDLFAVEYWELEQAKLKAAGKRAPLEGKVAVVSGAAAGIGRAALMELQNLGACVVALDIDERLAELASESVLAVHCDVTDGKAIDSALQQAVLRFGGLDILVSNAGNFPPSQSLAEIDDELWQKSLDLNLTAHMKLLRACQPFLEQGFDPAVVFVASKNVPAPGPGAAAYSAAKAGLTQLARVAALELGGKGIRVNTLHPNAVYDTGLWSEQILQERAGRYGLSVTEYKTANVLKTEVKSADVARAIAMLAGTMLAKTTGAQLAVDGGNERVI
ncbi:MAG: SDR family oxidoreductase, partial [Gammaproteobacteria bacterium]